MRERELFLLFIVYSIVPLFVSLLLIVTKMTTFIVVPMHVLGLFPNMLQVLAIIFPWVLFAMNAHIYFVKKIQGQGMPKMFLGVTIIQGLFSLIALLLLLSIVFF